MKQYILNYFEKFKVDELSCKKVLGFLDKIGEIELLELQKLYTNEYPIKLDQMEQVLISIANKTQLNKRAVNLVAVLSLLKILEKRLQERGVCQQIIDKTLVDAVYKMRECKRVYGQEGLMQFSWFKAILEERCFGIGRLQFEIDAYRLDEYGQNGNSVKKGEPVLSVHIPGSGEEFSEQACLESYKSAVKFYRRFFPNVFKGAIPFTSWTWLLYPKNSLFLRENSNILRFQKDFDIVEIDEYKTNDSIAWRIFDVEKIENIDLLPEKTYLQKKVKEYIKDGNTLGWGYGVFFMG